MLVSSFRMTEHVAVFFSYEVQPSGCIELSRVCGLEVTCGLLVVFGWSVVENTNMQS